jgi:hypothetical protein
MQELNEKKVDRALEMRSKISNIPHNSIKSYAVGSITFSEATEPDWSSYVARGLQLGRPVLVTTEDEAYPCPRIEIFIQSFELPFILGMERMIVTTRDNKTARPSSHATTASVYRFLLPHHRSRSTTSS